MVINIFLLEEEVEVIGVVIDEISGIDEIE